MTTSTLDVGDLLSVLGAQGTEKQLGRIVGVGRGSVNPVSGSTAVANLPAKTSLAKIKAAIKECGFHCAGEALPKHVCQAHTDAHEAGVPAIKPTYAKTKHKATGGEKSDAMDVHAMARDMRNRFWIAFGFTVPIFFLSPKGMDFIKVAPPFGMRLELVLFILAGAAILYPVWPFFVAAYRSLRRGVANMAVLVVLSVSTGYLFSVGSTFIYGGQQFYEASAVLLVFILLLHHRSTRQWRNE